MSKSKHKLTTASKKKQSHMTPEQIKQKMDSEIRAKKIREELRNQNPELFDAFMNGEVQPLPDLTGKKVKLNQEHYDRLFERGGNPKMKLWYNENKDKEFVVSREYNRNIYELDGVEYWLFNYYDLEVIE